LPIAFPLVPIDAGVHKLGPPGATLRVKTQKGGAAAMAGHNLVIEVTSWEATLDAGEPATIELSADPGSLRVREGSGGAQKLGDDDMADIDKTIVEEVLEGDPIEFHSTSVERSGDALSVKGDLTLAGRDHPLAFDLATAGGRLTGTATVKQSDWGIEPYTALFGTLKVLDEVEVEVEASLTG
jgi:hypothetical protein